MDFTLGKVIKFAEHGPYESDIYGSQSFSRIGLFPYQVWVGEGNNRQFVGNVWGEQLYARNRTTSFPNSLTRITMPANMHDDNLDGMGNTTFVNYYMSQNKAAGTYILNGQIWTRQ